MKRATFDPSKRVDLYARIRKEGTITLNFYNSDGSAYSFVYDEFQFVIKQNQGDKYNLILLGLGTGLSISSNVLTVQLSESQTNLNEGEYYYELIKNDIGKVWLNGLFFFHNGVFDGVTNG